MRFATGVVVLAALALSGWAFWRWQTPLNGNALRSPFQFDGAYPPSWSDALPSVVPLLVNAIGAAMLLADWAKRIESRAATNLPPLVDAGPDTPAGARRSPWSRILDAITEPNAMTTWATVIGICCALMVLIVLVAPDLRWKTVTGISVMVELVDFTGLLPQVEGWAVLVVLLPVSLAIVIFLYANARPLRPPENSGPRSHEGRQ